MTSQPFIEENKTPFTAKGRRVFCVCFIVHFLSERSYILNDLQFFGTHDRLCAVFHV